MPRLSTTGMTTKFFDLQKFNFGCAVNTAETAAGVATPCTITAVGYDTTGKQVYTQSFNFNPGTLTLRTQMASASLAKTWTGLNSVTLSTSNSAGVLTGTLINNVQYTAWSWSGGRWACLWALWHVRIMLEFVRGEWIGTSYSCDSLEYNHFELIGKGGKDVVYIAHVQFY